MSGSPSGLTILSGQGGGVAVSSGSGSFTGTHRRPKIPAVAATEAFSMARLRIRLVFNPGRVGAPMDKLGEFSSQTERFLRAFSLDLGIAAKKGEWIAENFTNDSVSFDAEFAAPVPDEVASRGREALETITGSRPLDAC